MEKKLVLISHGHCVKRERLSRTGQEQMKYLALALKPKLEGYTLRMIFSNSPQTADSAAIIDGEFKMTEGFERHPELRPVEGRELDVWDAIDLIQQRHEDVGALLVVTHQEYGQEIPYHFIKRVFNRESPRKPLPCGQARIISCTDGSSLFLS